MKPGLSLGGELALESARRAVPRLHRHDLEAQLDSALVSLASTREMLNQAMRRVMELEIQQINQQPARHQSMTLKILALLRAEPKG